LINNKIVEGRGKKGKLVAAKSRNTTDAREKRCKNGPGEREVSNQRGERRRRRSPPERRGGKGMGGRSEICQDREIKGENVRRTPSRREKKGGGGPRRAHEKKEKKKKKKKKAYNNNGGGERGGDGLAQGKTRNSDHLKKRK